MEIQQGYLLISDITGYTRFLVESELGHAKEILDSLLTATIDSIEAPVRVLNTRGDAVVAFVSDDQFRQPQSLLESIERIYLDFRRQLEFMDINTTCDCQACINMSALDLKLFLHHGEYIEQDLGGAIELQGADVILVNLLMKNHVKEATGLTGYGVITDAAVEAMGAEGLTSEMTVHHETYEHFGQVRMRIWDLPSRWETEKTRQSSEPDPESAWIAESIDTSAPPWVAWDHATDEEQKRVYYDMKSVERVDDLGGPVRPGSKFHCVHELGDVRFTITEWNPPHWFRSDEVALGIPVRFTMQIIPTDFGSTLRILYDEPAEGDPEQLEELFREAARDALGRLAFLLDSA